MGKIHLELLDFEVNPDSIASGFTQSEMTTLDSCAEKWYLSYNLMLRHKGEFSWALQYGSWIHAFLEEFYSTKGKNWSWDATVDKQHRKFMSAASMVEAEYYDKIGQVQSEIYASHYKNDRELYKWDNDEIETIIDLEFEGVRLTAKIDLPVFHKPRKAWFIMDHKTTGRLDKSTVMAWDIRFQFMFYLWLAKKQWPDRKWKGFIPNAIKKPQLKQGASEHIDSFCERVRTDMLQRPETYFYRDALVMTKGKMEEFENKQLRPKLARIKMLLDPKISDKYKQAIFRNMNGDQCTAYGKPCQFLNLCHNGMAVERGMYVKREVKHEELAP